ncbi:hypothetical protein M433DRAFT_74296 [Acidomyces richmondensis BFW]|jgi:hypothetical protein|nr:MAG: hypothetical protein FE78DRAFT_137839 [Acidomyces sp. 'richmondensis']KYG42204.1 hypothetical protein M433DRAFT_74296 [Acidomyces richmondensis BFW]
MADAVAPSNPPPQWLAILNSPPSVLKPRSSAVLDPPGFISASSAVQSRQKRITATPARKPPTPEEMDKLKLKKAWELAIAPAKQLPMNAFGMYMTGNSLQIFSIMMVFMLFKAPIQAILNIQPTFARLETESNRQQMVLVKLAFVACNTAALALGLWKLNGMGLLPTTRSDWLAWENAREVLERAVYVPPS